MAPASSALKAQIAILVRGHDDDRQVGAGRMLARKRRMNSAPSSTGMLKSVITRSGGDLIELFEGGYRMRERAHLDILRERTGQLFEDFEIGDFDRQRSRRFDVPRSSFASFGEPHQTVTCSHLTDSLIVQELQPG